MLENARKCYNMYENARKFLNSEDDEKYNVIKKIK